MSRRAYWPAEAPSVADAAEGTTPPIPAHGAPGGALGALRVRSEVDLRVKLGRLADLLVEAGGIVRELSQVSLADARETRLMSRVETTIPARLLTAEDLAARLQVDARTIRRWRRREAIPAGLEICGVLRWTEQEIDAWIAAGGRP